MSVRPYGVSVGVLSHFQFLDYVVSYYKKSIIKLTWYVLKVINMHYWSPSGPLGLRSEKKMSYVHYITRGGKAKFRTLKLTSVVNHLPSVSPKLLYAIAHLGYMYPLSAYILVTLLINLRNPKE